MTKKLVSFDDQAEPGEGLPAAVKAELKATYATVVQVVADGTDQTAQINAALATGVAYGLRKTVKLTGDFTITGALVIHSHTTLDATDATINMAVGVEDNMIRNAAALGTGPRTTDAHIRGGFWDRGMEGGSNSAPSTWHGILFHRADRVSVSDLRYNSGGTVKYCVFFTDVTDYVAERLDLTSTSDGVHVTGPAARGRVFDIVGDTHDDLVSFTGSDYPNYNLTVGGGNITDIDVARIHMRAGNGNCVKLLPGQNATLARAKVRDITGNPDFYQVVVYSDEYVPETMGGIVEDVLIDGVSGRPGNQMVVIQHPDVRSMVIRNVDVSDPNLARPVRVTGGGVVTSLVVDGVSTSVPFSGSIVNVSPGTTVKALQVSNITSRHTATVVTGAVVFIDGVVESLQMSNIVQSGGEMAVYSSGTLSRLSITGLDSTAKYGLSSGGSGPTETHISHVTGMPTVALARGTANSSEITLRGSQLCTSASPHLIGRSGYTPRLRAVGAEVRADVSLLSPQEGDMVFNTNAALSCGAGPVIFSGTVWRHLATAATYTPPPATAVLDTFSRTGEVVGTMPDVGPSAWTGATSAWVADGADLVRAAGAGGGAAVWVDPARTGPITVSGVLSLSTTDAASRRTRIYLGGSGSNAALLQFSLTTTATVYYGEWLDGLIPAPSTLSNAIPANTASADYPFSMSLSGNQLTVTVDSATATLTLSQVAVTAFAASGRVGVDSSDPSVKVRSIKVTAP